MPERYPGYDVLNKRDTVSWNDKTREVLARFGTVEEYDADGKPVRTAATKQ